MSKQLIVDYGLFEVSTQQINESLANNNGKLIVNGVLQRADARNQNGRVYPMETLMREAKKYESTYIAERRALGELDHPDSSVVNLNNVSHNILGIAWKGHDLVGTVEVLPTPSGNILKALFQSGIKLGISSRGLGSVKEVMREGNSAMEVQPDFELIAFDFVSNPSTHGAFLSPVNESINSKLKSNKYGNIERIISDIIMEF
jgi:hypothetical protein